MRIARWDLLAALSVTSARAMPAPTASPGVALRWNQCYGDGGNLNRTFACNSNTFAHTLVGSFSLAHDALAHWGNEFVLYLAAARTQFPAWWDLKNPDSCRPSSLTIEFGDPTAVSCPDWASGQASGAITSYLIGHRGPNTARITAASATRITTLDTKSAGEEYFSFRLRITNAKTVGAGACGGCDVPVCFVLQSIKYITNGTGPYADQLLTGPLNGTDSHFATWQGGGVPTTPGGTGCPAATPTRRGRWGSVKALYR